MSFQYTQYQYPIAQVFQKELLWTSVDCPVYFAFKLNSTDAWTFFAGNVSHSLDTGKYLTSYGSDETTAATNYFLTTRDTGGKTLAVLPSNFQAKYARLYIEEGHGVTIYEWTPSVYITANEIITGTLEITDLLADNPLISVVAEGRDRLRIGKVDSRYGLFGYNVSGNKILEISDVSTLLCGFSLGENEFHFGETTTRLEFNTSTGFHIGATSFSDAPFRVSLAGELKAEFGTIGGWNLTSTLLQSTIDGTARIELNQTTARISIKDAANSSKVVMGYLNGLPKNNGVGNWEAGDYGFWAADGDNLQIDGDVVYKSGDWIIENDGSFLVQDYMARTILRLGTDSGEKGVFIYDTAGTQLAKFVSDEVFIGEATKYFQYTVAGGLVVKTTNFELSSDGTMTATGGTFRNSASSERLQIDSNGLTIYSGNTAVKYSTFKYGTTKHYGAGVRFQLGSPARNVPVYFPASTNYADIHFSARASTPTGAAEVDDVCSVNGILYVCTGAGTPGTWTVVGTQT